MEITDRIASQVAEAIKELYGQEVSAEALQLQETRPEFEGNLTLVTFPLLKISHKKPEDTAREIGERLLAQAGGTVEKYNVVKGFLNISLTVKEWTGMLESILKDPTYGFTPVTEEAPLVMIEYSSPNTNKPLHLGHVRNNLLGWALAQVMEANGNRVVKTNIVNVRGIDICKSMRAWLKYGNGETQRQAERRVTT